MPTSAWLRRSTTDRSIAGTGGPGRARRWAWLVLGVGALLATGTVIVALDPGVGSRSTDALDDPVAPAFAPSTLPFDVTAVAPVIQGQSVVAPAPASRSTPPLPVTPNAATLQLDAETVRAADLQVGIAAGTYAEVFERALSIGPAYGGFVASSTSTLDAQASAGQVVLRVPVANFDAARRAVGALGEVEMETVRGQDVSAQLVDYEARLRSLEVQEEALRTLLGRTANVGEVLQIQPQLSGVRQQIEQLKAQQTRLQDSAAMSTLLVMLHEPDGRSARPSSAPKSGLSRRIEEAADGALAVVGGMIVALGWSTPVVALLGAGYGVVRLRRRRSPPA